DRLPAPDVPLPGPVAERRGEDGDPLARGAPEDPRREREEALPALNRESRVRQIGHWVGGGAVAGSAGRSGPVVDPARGEETGRVAFASAAEVLEAVKVAVDASAEWGTSPLARRAALMFKLRELIDMHRDDLARIVTREHGKVLDDARGEVARGLECVEFACGIPHLLKGAHSSEVSRGIDVHTVLQPLGVVAGITPFNFPVMVPLWMLANAVACGNAFVL